MPEKDEMQVFWKRLDQHQEEIVQLRESRAEDRARMTSLENAMKGLESRVVENHAELKVSQSHLGEEMNRHFDRISTEVRTISQSLLEKRVRDEAADQARASALADRKHGTMATLKAAGVIIAAMVAFVALAQFIGGVAHAAL